MAKQPMLRQPSPAATTRFGEVPNFTQGLYECASGAYAYMVPNGSWGETNIGLIDCGGESVLIDTCWDLKFTRELLKVCELVTSRSPIEYVINTHADGDHCWGNQLFADKPIIATAKTRAAMAHIRPDSLRLLKGASRVMARLPKLAVSQRANQAVLLGHYMAGMFAPYDFTGVALTPPTETFSGERSLYVRGTQIVLRELGPAHSDGDALVYVPSRSVLYAGDILFVGATPVMWAGPLENMTAGLRALCDYKAQVIVPGHGPFATLADIERLLEYWDWVPERLQRCALSGMSSFEAAQSVALSQEFQQKAFAKWDSAERIFTSAATLYLEWGISEDRLPGKLGELAHFARQATLAEQLADNTPRRMHRFN